MLYKEKDNKNDIIDIILLTYNNIENTRFCINHLYRYTENFGLIILDNNSEDGTVDYLKKIADENDNITLYLSPSNLGCVNGRNYAYTLSKDTEYICFLDNDQFVQTGWLRSYLAYMDEGYDIVGTEGWKLRSDLFPLKKVNKYESYNYVGCGGMVIRRKVIEDIGLFDIDYNPMYFEDPTFCFTAYNVGYKICWNDKEKIYHKPHKLLGHTGERPKYFRRSLSIFREKWKDYKIPIFENPIAK